MKKITLKKSRGASMAEYALLLVAILLIAATAFKSLGKDIKTRTTEASSALS
jgi:Flp pilus assembly pilin Flp